MIPVLRVSWLVILVILLGANVLYHELLNPWEKNTWFAIWLCCATMFWLWIPVGLFHWYWHEKTRSSKRD